MNKAPPDHRAYLPLMQGKKCCWVFEKQGFTELIRKE